MLEVAFAIFLGIVWVGDAKYSVATIPDCKGNQCSYQIMAPPLYWFLGEMNFYALLVSGAGYLLVSIYEGAIKQ